MIEQLLTEAKNACRTFQMVDTDTKIQALHAIAQKLIDQQDRILQANQKDIAQAKENGISAAMMDRLLLSPQRIQEMSEGVRMVAHLSDPIGQVIREMDRPNGLRIKQIRIPIGTVGVVYEARPNVTVDIAAICIKTNNVCILKGGKEAYYSNMALAQVMQEAIADILPVSPIYMIDAIDHEVVTELITDREHVDVIIPRGGKGLIQHVVQNAKVPVIETGAGLCHLYVDKEADIDMALQIAQNAKLQRPSVCNAIETILVHTDVAKEFLTRLAPMFAKVQVFGDARSLQYIPGEMATKENYATEYDDYKINIKVVDSMNEAIEHIYTYSTKHSECIVTKDDKRAQYFMDALDSACVYQNASTRFTDGGQFGFGAEVGISTQKLHARGPIGLSEMCSTKYEIYGNGQIRE
ncbi:glutamate-5-semialdehyde dehydrogenase [Absicoccus intestinalis]|uniref:Gamma-glutamyl phosphate reductase n=1 Tax=Absicoccus intestinalis TaxID=2926319 RepID=A0ABU4WIM0_9FIRM|nr:glutamate-5-semialdehyde dehydrogenase [Absicoccus sp. CLA-KB-P134]MDX8416401.1 glutamate-5-semialdehyde dehydrogenase [Absicoccus sp. CLA-KB-P134]